LAADDAASRATLLPSSAADSCICVFIVAVEVEEGEAEDIVEAEEDDEKAGREEVKSDSSPSKSPPALSSPPSKESALPLLNPETPPTTGDVMTMAPPRGAPP